MEPSKIIHLFSLILIIFSILSFYFSTFPKVCTNEDIDPIVNFIMILVTAIWCIFFIVYVAISTRNNIFVLVYLSCLLFLCIGSVIIIAISNKDISEVKIKDPEMFSEISLGLNVSILSFSLIFPMLLIFFSNLSPTIR